MTGPDEHAAAFLALHRPGSPLLLPNAWDLGSAALLAELGFAALATTSAGHAWSLGRRDGELTRDEVLAQAATLAAHTGLPVTADLEHGYADTPEGVAETISLAVEAGLAGASIEDYDPAADRLLDLERSRDTVAAAARAAHRGDHRLVLTARAENFFRGRPDLDDTIARLRAYQDAGADVLYAPGLTGEDQIAAVLAAVDRPLNVLLLRDGPEVGELAALGVSRVSLGGALARVSLNAARTAASELRDRGTFPFPPPPGSIER